MAETQTKGTSKFNFEQCLKCSICTVYCPVSTVEPTYPGPKQSGPDNERYRMKNPEFFDEALKLCLNCKRCEVACPEHVKVGDLIQKARIQYSTHKPSLRDRMLASTGHHGPHPRPPDQLRPELGLDQASAAQRDEDRQAPPVPLLLAADL